MSERMSKVNKDERASGARREWENAQTLREIERVNVGCIYVFSFIILWVYVHVRIMYLYMYILYMYIVYLMYIFMCAYNIISTLCA